MKKETIERNKEKIKEVVFDNREVFEQLMKEGGFGWGVGIENDDVLLDNVYETLEITDEYTKGRDVLEEYFDFAYYEEEMDAIDEREKLEIERGLYENR